VSAAERAVADALAAVDTLATLARQAAREWVPSAVKDGPEEDGRRNVPPDERQVLVFLNGHVTLDDDKGRNGGGHGIRMGWFDHDRGFWRVGGSRESDVTHWMELPADPVIAPWPPVLS
jgi:hypothetical protein